ncbi:hypothetical protein ACFSW8_10155, partial [Rubritalea tangerina]
AYPTFPDYFKTPKNRLSPCHSYLSHSDHSAVRIDVPKGTYVPSFYSKDQNSAPAPISPQKADKTSSKISKPALAVVIFDTISDDKAHFATGITRQLLVDLSRFKKLTVLGPIDATQLPQAANCPSIIGEQLKVRFVLQGCVQHQGNHIRISVNLTDTSSRALVWGQNFDRDLSKYDIFDLQDEIARRCAAFIAGDLGIITMTLYPETKAKAPTEREDYEAALLAYHAGIVLTHEAMLSAREALESSIKNNPNYALTKALLADLYCIEYFCLSGANTSLLQRAESLAKDALALDRECQDARWIRGQVHFFKGEFQRSKRELEAAIALNPNNPSILASCAFYLPMLDQWHEALELSLRAIRLNPQHPAWYNFTPALYYFMHGPLEKAVSHAERLEVPDLFWGALLRSAIFADAGHDIQARKEAQKLLILQPDFDNSGRLAIKRFLVQEKTVNKITNAIQKIGISVSEVTLPPNITNT